MTDEAGRVADLQKFLTSKRTEHAFVKVEFEAKETTLKEQEREFDGLSIELVLAQAAISRR